MHNPLTSFSGLPKPVMAVSLLASGAGVVTIFFALQSDNPAWKVAAGGLIAIGLIMALYKLVLMMRDKSKSSPFAAMISRGGTGGGRAGGVDPAAKARMDDLRKKFEEGVTAFRSAGKDLYSLPWFLLVGPSGAGKTEALRHSNVGFPPGLQDCLQGTGGTLNMHWWFTNHAVVLDTAGRMFMEEAAEGQSTEWKEFLKLLKQARANCPVNGLLLVISAESLLKDSAEKIEKTAGAIARQLDTIQRTLEVRFPVTVLVTKCDKIVGFREFFETVTDPTLQHQILGWSNPASLDEAFRPDNVESHLSGVRERLMKRRLGLIQNPVHSTDAQGRRIDEVDQLFEFPDNMMRIAPRLRRYLELIFVAGEWSPKPLFLRGIFFTSSMREGQALDVSLAQALGVDVESLPGDSADDREKAYFLRDVFLGKVFKERGLVTRAAHVGKHLARQRAWIVGGSLAAAVVVGGMTLLSIFGYRSSLGPPSEFWASMGPAFERHVDEIGKEGRTPPLSLFSREGDQWVYLGDERPEAALGLPSGMRTKLAVLEATGENTKEIQTPLVAWPVAKITNTTGKDFSDRQVMAHRALVESAALEPLLQAVRERIGKERDWSPAAVSALAQLVRLHTVAATATPAADTDPKNTAEAYGLVDVKVLADYALGTDKSLSIAGDLSRLQTAVKLAYPTNQILVQGATEVDAASRRSLFSGDIDWSWKVVEAASTNLLNAIAAGNLGGQSDLGKIEEICNALDRFEKVEGDPASYAGALSWLTAQGAGADAAGARSFTRLDGYREFAQSYRARAAEVAQAAGEIRRTTIALGKSDAEGIGQALTASGQAMVGQVAQVLGQVRGQLPGELSPTTPEALRAMAQAYSATQAGSRAAEAVKRVEDRVAQTRERLTGFSHLLATNQAPAGTEGAGLRLYEARARMHELASQSLERSETAGQTPERAVVQFVARRAAVASQIESATSAVRRLTVDLVWMPAVDPARARLDQSGRITQGVLGVARGRAEASVFEAALSDPCWAGVEAMGQAVRQAVADRLDEGTLKETDELQPAVPLSAMVGPDGSRRSYDRRFLPEVARDVFAAWESMERELGAGTTGSTIVGREDLAARLRDIRSTGNAYLAEYMRYWEAQGTEAPMPTARSWEEFRDGLNNITGRTVAGPLAAARKRSVDALRLVPESLGGRDAIKGATDAVERAYAGLDDEFDRRMNDDLLRAWKLLGRAPSGDGATAAQAADTLRRSIQMSRLRLDYFQAYVPQGQPGHVKYCNELLLAGLGTIVQASQGPLGQAWATLTQTARAVPLARGPVDMPDLTPEQVKAVIDAAGMMGAQASAPGAPAAGPRERLGERRVDDLISQLMGDGYLRDESAQRWFAGLRGAADFASRDRIIARVDYHPKEIRPVRSRPGAALVSEKYYYIALFVSGERIANRNMTTLAPLIARDAPAQPKGDVQLPARQGGAELRFYAEDPGNRPDRFENADAVIPIAGGSAGIWGPMRGALTDPDARQMTPADGDGMDGSWLVPLTSADGRYYIWVSVRFVEPKPPALQTWPEVTSWPGH